MAEAVGFVASIIGILELTNRAVRYLKSIKDAKEDRRRLLNEVVNASSLLSLLKMRVEGDQVSPNDPTLGTVNPLETMKSLETVKLLLIPDGPRYQIQTLLEYLIYKLQPGDNRGIKRLKETVWPFKEAEYKEIIHSLERYKTCFLLAIQNDHLYDYYPIIILSSWWC